jgi:aryl-alcohol dehydrogenase-like predicted oxidoreductase
MARFGLGLAALGRPAYINLDHAADLPEGRSVAAMEAHAHSVLDAAYAAGVRYFDAARSYGRAEEFLRSWLLARAHTDAEVGSKWGYRYTGDWQVDGRVQEVKDHGVLHLRAQVAESMALLGLWLRLYQIHSATEESRVLEDRAVLDELRRLRERGIALGVTVTGPRQADTIRRALSLRAGDGPLFAAVQATWNALERSAGPALREAHEAGVRVLIKEPLANGRLTPRGDVAPLRALAAQLGRSEDALALALVLQQPWADVVLLGAATAGQLRSNLRARDVPADALEPLEPLVEPPAGYWSRRARLPWN